MMPLNMFKKVSVAAMLAQSFLLGTAYYSYIYFLPLYFQNVRGKSPLISAALQLPLVVAQSTISTMAGLYMSWFNRYGEIIWFGFGIWTVGGGLLLMANETISIGLISFFLVIMGLGTGCVFQPTLVALQAHCPKAQRAVVTSNRNFLRNAGGALGLAVSSAILANVLKASLPPRLAAVANSTFATPNFSHFSLEDQAVIKHAYSAASRAVFIWCVPITGISFLLSVFIKDHGLTREEEREAATPPSRDVEAQATISAVAEKDEIRLETPVKDGDTSYSVPVELHSPDASPDVSRKPSLSSEKSGKAGIA
jgi:hypothetical protein